MGNAFIELQSSSESIPISDYERAYDLNIASRDATYIKTDLLESIPSAFFSNYSQLSYI